MDQNSPLHTSWEFTCHIVWIQKYGRKVPCGQAGREVGAIPGTLVEWMDGVEKVEGSVCHGHIHICFRIAPNGMDNVVGKL